MLHDLDRRVEISVMLGNPEICITWVQKAKASTCLEVDVLYSIPKQRRAFALVIASPHP